MRYSRRTRWNTEESDLARAHRLRLESGQPLADLTASNPTRCGFTYPDSLLQALADPRALDYDPQPQGSLTARQSVCAYYHDHGVKLDPAQIVLTTSTSEGYSFLFRLLCDPGDEVLILQPGYPLFDFLAGLDDVNLKPSAMVYDHGWQIDPEAIRRAITPQTRAIVLVHPNNPTGHFTKPWEAAELARVCSEFSLALIVDEVFLDYSLGHQPFTFASGDTPVFNTPVFDTPVFVVSGLSKIAGLPQMKAAWIVVTGSAPDRAGSLGRLEVIADTFLSMNAPVQCALPHWLASRSEIQSQIRERTSANLAELDRHLAAAPSTQRLKVEGGWYAVLRIPALQPDEQTVRALLDRGVWVHPGYFFGMPESGWLVLSLITPVHEFVAGVTILVAYLQTHQGSNITNH
ncbi:MAG TPA: pyridoxal phosphate-dependent aminotransferase [Terracidiphilus sp.]|jgi:aspartate/methionine/tyrosine aminotransferase|nr:pyridoxal phosphate-dependent aminotransferase [Terracidiphilus sp.]